MNTKHGNFARMNYAYSDVNDTLSGLFYNVIHIIQNEGGIKYVILKNIANTCGCFFVDMMVKRVVA